MDMSAELSRFEENSENYRFFKKVFAKLGTKFLRKTVEDQLNEVHFKLNTEIENYFQSVIFRDAITKADSDLWSSQKNYCSNQKHDKLSGSEVSTLYTNMILRYLPPAESQDAQKPLGLDQSSASKVLRKRQKSKVEYEALRKQIEKNIDDFCMRIVECTGSYISPNRDWKESFDNTMKDLECKSTLLHSKPSETYQKLQKALKFYHEELLKGISLLKELLSLHIQRLEFETEVAELYQLRCYAVYLKAGILEKKVLESTYDETTIPALKKISHWLDQKEKSLEEEKNAKTIALETYEKLGQEYEFCVNEYIKLRKSVQDQKWFLEELKRVQPKHDA